MGNPERTRQERNKYRIRTANGYPHKGRGDRGRKERRKRKTQEEPGRKGTNLDRNSKLLPRSGGAGGSQANRKGTTSNGLCGSFVAQNITPCVKFTQSETPITLRQYRDAPNAE